MSAAKFSALLALTAGTAHAAEMPVLSQHGASPSGHNLRYDLGFDFLDFNGDGKQDLFLPVTGMTASQVALNEGTVAEPRFGKSFQYIINFTETLPQTVEHTQSYAIADLNSDGLFDYILFDGQLRYVPNTGKPHRPYHWTLLKGEKTYQYFPGSQAMVEENSRFSTGPESFFWKRGIFARQVLTLTTADWDGDGLQDLLISRFKDEAPGVVKVEGNQQWTPLGRFVTGTPVKQQLEGAKDFSGPLPSAPPRGLYFYKNIGTKAQPYFDRGIEIKTPAGDSIAAPNPVVADIDGDGVPDLLSCETKYSCNSFRVDWPARPNVVWFKRARAADTAVLQPEQAVTDAKGVPIASGTMARMGGLNPANGRDLFVMDPAPLARIRWYHNEAAPGTKPRYGAPRLFTGEDFMRFGMMSQPFVADWFAPGSRDLLMHGNLDPHCKWSLRRTALYRNAAKGGGMDYRFVGWLNYNGDEAMVPPAMEDFNYDVYGTAIGFYQDAGQKYLVMSVSGRLWLFSNLDKDGLTFRKRVELPIKAQRNRMKGWQEIPITTDQPLKYLRITGFPYGAGLGRDGFISVERLELLAGGKNIATPENIASVAAISPNDPTKSVNSMQRPEAMLDPAGETKPGKNFSTWGYHLGPMTLQFKQSMKLDKIRFLLPDREGGWYDQAWPFYWQGKLYHYNPEQGDTWFQYKIESSVDGQKWDTVVDRSRTEMNRSFPFMVDWNKDGKIDMLLGVQNAQGHIPIEKEYRLYLNTGTNAAPVFDTFQQLMTDKGTMLRNDADWGPVYACCAGVMARDLDGDGRLDLVTEGWNNAELLGYRNVSAAPGELRFAPVGRLGGRKPVLYKNSYRYFFYGDVDGDGIPDLLNSSDLPDFFKGVAATAPDAVTDLKLTAADKSGVQLQWTKPAKATRYEVRWSNDAEISDLNWSALPKAEGAYGAEPEQAAAVSVAASGKQVRFAVKSFNAAGEASEISDAAESVAAPAQQVDLRNGSAAPGGVEYNGNEAVTLDGSKPSVAGGLGPALQIESQEKTAKVVLLRFRDLPALKNLSKATLTLTTRLRGESLMYNAITVPMSCNALGDEWLSDKATWQEAAPGLAWKPQELNNGGSFLSFAQPVYELQPRQFVHWDVTEAVKQAAREGKTGVSLLVRMDYTGPYLAGRGYDFEGAKSPFVAYRPTLTLVSSQM